MKFLTYVCLFLAALGIAYFITDTDTTSPEPYSFNDPAPTQNGPRFDFDSSEPWEDDLTENELYFPAEQSETSVGHGMYYYQLSDFQKHVYDIMADPISRAETSFEITNIDTTTFLKESELAFIALQRDHPEYFWYMGCCSYTYWTYERRVVVEPYYYQYTQAFFDSEGKYDQLMQYVDMVADLARHVSTDAYARMLYVHDYLILNSIYDHDALAEYETTSHNPSCEYIFSAYGCLVNQRTVCAGYAMAYKLILNRLGYECAYVVGDAGGSHAWNFVYLEDKGYYVDVTWDDYDLKPEITAYNYAFINDETLARTHTVDHYFTLPDCTSMEHNFHVKQNYYLETYDYNSAINILSAQAYSNAIHIKFGSLEQMKLAEAELWSSQGRLFENSALADFSICYPNENHYTLTFVK